MNQLHRVITCFVILSACVGCRDRLVDVHAKVEMDGQPVEGAAVTLISAGDIGRRPASGVSDHNGIVRFTTYQPQDGVLPGDYKILVNKSTSGTGATGDTNLDPRNPEDMKRILEMDRPSKVPATRTILPRVYLSSSTTPLSCTISADTDEINIEINSSL